MGRALILQLDVLVGEIPALFLNLLVFDIENHLAVLAQRADLGILAGERSGMISF
jgi:hypothetical protein